jgi:hypothetical protein
MDWVRFWNANKRLHTIIEPKKQPKQQTKQDLPNSTSQYVIYFKRNITKSGY